MLLWTHTHSTDYVDRHGDNPGPRASPVVDGDRVYVHGAEGRLSALRVSDGSLLWSKDTSKDFGVVPNFFGVGSSPLVHAGLVVVQVGGSPPDSPDVASGGVRGAGSGLVGFDAATGAVRWKATDELASYGSPIVDAKGRGFVLARGGLIAFDPLSGKVDFQFPWRSPMVLSVNAASPVVDGDIVFVSECYSVGGAALRLKPGGFDALWQDGRKRDKALASWWNTPVVVDGVLYGDHGQNPSELRAVDFATGTVRWAEPSLKRCALIRADGRFIGLTEEGSLWLLRLTPEKCEKVSEAKLEGAGPWRSGPVLAGGRVYVRGKDRLLCLEVVPDPERALDRRLAAKPDDLDALSRRGDLRFFRGRFADAVADYDRMAALDPALEAGHWRRGIARFYAGDFAGAAKQFEIYHTVDQVDRENGIWRYLSQYKAYGKAKAREGLLKYAKDDREPFPAVYKLFSGETTPDEVLKGIEAASIGEADREGRRFYARLYIGLLLWVEGRAEDARIHLEEAARSAWPKSAGYGPSWMGGVARVHLSSARK
jgi:outer membrane protein assembly factor BamB